VDDFSDGWLAEELRLTAAERCEWTDNADAQQAELLKR
jgi:hypothetical protein